MKSSRTVIVTGACGAIGKAISRQMAERSFRVVMICRNMQGGETVANEIIRKTKNQDIRVEAADLSLLSEISGLAGKIREPVDVLVNNAATTPLQRMVSAENIEMQFAVNVLAYLRMALAFRQHLKIKSPSQIVNVASHYAGGLDMTDLQFSRRRYDNDAAYRQSKQANRMLTVALAARFKADGISVNACHPGGVNSKLSNSMGFGGSESPDQGAATPVWLASTAAGTESSGKWFDHMREVPCEFSRNAAAVEELYEICMQYCHGL